MKSGNILLLIVCLVQAAIVHGQSISLEDEYKFYMSNSILKHDGNSASPINGLVAVGEECYIVLKLNGYEKINDVLLYFDMVDGFSVEISYSLDDDYLNGTVIGNIENDFEEPQTISFPVNDYAKYITIKGVKQEYGYLRDFKIHFVEVTYNVYRTVYTYDGAGNRKTRNTIFTSTKSAKGGIEDQAQRFIDNDKIETLVYPNPTAGLLNFEISCPGHEKGLNIQVEVYTISGSLIIDKVYHSNRFDIDITDQPNGTYLLDLFVNNKKQAFTIIKK